MLRGAGRLLGSVAVGLLGSVACVARISLLTAVGLSALGAVGRRLSRLQRYRLLRCEGVAARGRVAWRRGGAIGVGHGRLLRVRLSLCAPNLSTL